MIARFMFFYKLGVTTDERRMAFDELKKRLTTAPVLTLPDQTKRFTVYCDASKDGLGCVLMQEGRVDWIFWIWFGRRHSV